MREQPNKNLLTKSLPANSKPETYLGTSLLTVESLSNQVAYNEMADFPVQYIDPVAQVQKNLDHLEELQARMKFMMREVRYLMKI